MERNYAQIEKELLAIVFGLERFHQFTYGVPVWVESDHKPLEMITRKALHMAPKRLQRMLLRLQQYSITVVYKPGKDMHLADTLSRSCLPETSLPDDNYVLQFYEELQAVDMVQDLSLSAPKKAEIQDESRNDKELQCLKQTVQRGWPSTKHELPYELRSYYDLRDEISYQDDVLFRGQRVIIPKSMRASTLVKIHRSHLGVHGCTRRARDVVFWPGMTADIKQHVEKCEVCRSMETRQQKETLKSHEVPNRPWGKVGTDLCHIDGKDYLITVDYFSNFAEVDRARSTTSREIVKLLKKNFARYGIPDIVISDNGPQFNSGEFRKFAQDWQFEHQTSSPHYHQSNGKAENSVKTVKRLLKKAKMSGDDPYLALLEFRNTPTESLGVSPSQCLFSRRTKTTLPTTESLLQPQVQTEVHQKLQQSKDKQAIGYNKNAKDLKELEPGLPVRMQPTNNQTGWKKAIVSKMLPNRSYEVVTSSGTVYTRNRRHLKETKEQSHQKQKTPGVTTPEASRNAMTKKVPTTQDPALVTTRSGRIVKPPKYLSDYVV